MLGDSFLVEETRDIFLETKNFTSQRSHLVEGVSKKPLRMLKKVEQAG